LSAFLSSLLLSLVSAEQRTTAMTETEFKTACRLRSLLDQQAWTFARTMPDNPHEYALRKRWCPPDTFDGTVNVIRQLGSVEKFRGSPYTVLQINEHIYWTMGAPVRSTILINRKRVSAPAAYDPIAKIYDDLFQDAESLQENRKILDRVPVAGQILDIGCGTGLLLDGKSIQPENYYGIDPSRAMLEQLHAKHPRFRVRTLNVAFESYFPRARQKFDSIIALFGSLNYIHPSAWNRLPFLLRPGGTLFLMMFKPDYYPKTNKRSGRDIPFFPTPTSWPGSWPPAVAKDRPETATRRWRRVVLGFPQADIEPFNDYRIVRYENL